MLTLPSSVRIYLCTAVTDMRKGHDGLSALVQHHMELDVFSGHLFVFVSRLGNRVKILFWDNGGFVLLYKRLEKGKFRLPPLPQEQATIRLEATPLALLPLAGESRLRGERSWCLSRSSRPRGWPRSGPREWR